MPGIAVRPFDAPITYNTSFVLPSGRQPSELARQFMEYVKTSTAPDDYSELV
jgi:hypothetical protein